MCEEGESDSRRYGNDILRITGQDEVMQSFVRIDSTGSEKDEEITTQEKDKKITTFNLNEADNGTGIATTGSSAAGKKIKEKELTKVTTKPLYASLGKEYDDFGLKKTTGKRRSSKRQQQQYRMEEVYTDKDRAAAVNLGSRDIKQSLKLKRRQDISRIFEISEEEHPGILLSLGNHELRNKDVKVAINFVNKALELNPYDKNALVTRSKCYLLLGKVELAFDDAEKALQLDKIFIKGIYQKAEALYHLGKFEHSLMYFYRGLHLRPEMDDFRLGVQKAQQAIENTIGNLEPVLNISRSSSSKAIENNQIKINRNATIKENVKDGIKNSSQCQSRVLLKELFTDKKYLENLLLNPDIRRADDNNNKIQLEIKEGMQFLENREEFWKQYHRSS